MEIGAGAQVIAGGRLVMLWLVLAILCMQVCFLGLALPQRFRPVLGGSYRTTMLAGVAVALLAVGGLVGSMYMGMTLLNA